LHARDVATVESVRHEVAWAAGLFEGEGSITLSGAIRVVQLRNCDEEIVRRFHKVLRVGKFYGPYVNRASERDGYPRQDYFHWAARGQDCEIALEMMWPWLSTRRRRRAVEVGYDVPPFLEPVY
jgi:hypothetical protein